MTKHNTVMPAEWEEHEATWLSWPKNRSTFPERIIEKVENTFTQIVKALSEHEKVKILVDNAQEEERVNNILEQASVKKNVEFKRIVSSDVWIRDYGPTFVRNTSGKIKAIKWTYNAYGDKYDDLKYDDKTGEEVVRNSGKEIIRPGIILEGGSIEVNGKGTLITTEQCLLNKNRNSHLTREQIEDKLKDLLGVKHIIWLGEGVVGDDTDGHIDDIARFVDERTVVCAHEENKNDENYEALKADYEKLCESADQDGNKLNVLKLPMPKAVLTDQGERLPASYANFLIANKVVLLPVFDDPNDKKAIEIMQKAMPHRKIIPIDCRYLVWGYGTIHCSSQQEPKGK